MQRAFALSALTLSIWAEACEGSKAGDLDRSSDTPVVGPAAIEGASLIRFPGETDSNSPAHWSGGRIHVFNSVDSSNGEPRQWVPVRSTGNSVADLGDPTHVQYLDHRFNGLSEGRQWIEATWKDERSGVLYAWYHNEPWSICGTAAPALTAPRIGALRSVDDGLTFEDLGLILEAPHGTLRCDSANNYFAGGHGDFSVMLDAKGEYFYFLFSNFAGDVSAQGVSLAWMAFEDRDHPSGKVWKWNDGDWMSPGLGGASTPIFPATGDWMSATPDSFWGPSIHWNTYLEEYVVLLNRAQSPGFDQEGVYVSFARDLADPGGWTPPMRILDVGTRDWYPQVIGLESEGTDKLAGKVARLFVLGRSEWVIDFSVLRAHLAGRVTAGGDAGDGLLVSAWGQAQGDFHLAYTDGDGDYVIRGLEPDSLYNMVVNARWTPDGYVVADDRHDWTQRNNVRVPRGDEDHREDLTIAY